METALQALSGQAPESDVSKNARAELSALTQDAGANKGDGFMRSLDSGMRGAADTMSFGFADELSALGNSTVDAMRGKPGQYDRRLFQERVNQEIRDQNDPVASNVGRVAGALTGGIGLAKQGLTLMGRGLPAIPAAMAEGGLYGGAYGFGSGEGGLADRGVEAAKGAGVGALTGGVVQGLGGAIANRLASRAASRTQPAAPAVDDLASQSRALYDASKSAGVTIKVPAFQRVAAHARYAAGNVNRDLRPNTAGILDDIKKLSGKPVTLEQLDELRQVVGQSMKRAQPQDIRTLERIKTVLDNFADNAKPGDITGDIRGFDYIKEARKLWARKSKAELLEKIMSDADLDTSKYTQSGMVNSIVSKFRTLAKNQKQMKMFSTEEQALIRQIVKGGKSERVLRLIGKLAPRGVVSAGMGAGVIGSLIPGGAFIVPAIGSGAAAAADNAALAGVKTLQDAVARGFVARPQIPNFQVPFIGGPGTLGAATSNQLQR
jgi:hypothetical protein